MALVRGIAQAEDLLAEHRRGRSSGGRHDLGARRWAVSHQKRAGRGGPELELTGDLDPARRGGAAPWSPQRWRWSWTCYAGQAAAATSNALVTRSAAITAAAALTIPAGPELIRQPLSPSILPRAQRVGELVRIEADLG